MHTFACAQMQTDNETTSVALLSAAQPKKRARDNKYGAKAAREAGQAEKVNMTAHMSAATTMATLFRKQLGLWPRRPSQADKPVELTHTRTHTRHRSLNEPQGPKIPVSKTTVTPLRLGQRNANMDKMSAPALKIQKIGRKIN